MKKNISYLRASLVLAGLLFIGCETGVDVKSKNSKLEEQNSDLVSGIVTKPTSQIITTKSGKKVSVHQIYSNAAQPGYYLQIAYFEEYKPNDKLEKQIKNSGFKYTVLNKNDNYYMLIGAYKSYNEAYAHKASVRAKLHINSFVVDVLRP